MYSCGFLKIRRVEYFQNSKCGFLCPGNWNLKNFIQSAGCKNTCSGLLYHHTTIVLLSLGGLFNLYTGDPPRPLIKERYVFQDSLDQDSLKLLWTPMVPARSIAVDRLKQLYLLGEDNQLRKYDPDGRLLFTFEDRSLGEPKLVDCGNPFFTLVVYPDFPAVVLLDRTLSAQQTVRLTDWGLSFGALVALSPDNQLWTYDPLLFRLRKYNLDGKLLLESPDLNQLLGGPPTALQLVAEGTLVGLLDARRGLLVFDGFGQLADTYPEPQPMESITLFESQFFARSNGRWYQLQKLGAKPLDLPPSDQVLLDPKRIYLLRADQVEVYERPEKGQ